MRSETKMALMRAVVMLAIILVWVFVPEPWIAFPAIGLAAILLLTVVSAMLPAMKKPWTVHYESSGRALISEKYADVRDAFAFKQKVLAQGGPAHLWYTAGRGDSYPVPDSHLDDVLGFHGIKVTLAVLIQRYGDGKPPEGPS